MRDIAWLGICGWRTRTMLSRYNIVNTETMASAQELLELKRQQDLANLEAELKQQLAEPAFIPISFQSAPKLPDSGAKQPHLAKLEN